MKYPKLTSKFVAHVRDVIAQLKEMHLKMPLFTDLRIEMSCQTLFMLVRGSREGIENWNYEGATPADWWMGTFMIYDWSQERPKMYRIAVDSDRRRTAIEIFDETLALLNDLHGKLSTQEGADNIVGS